MYPNMCVQRVRRREHAHHQPVISLVWPEHVPPTFVCQKAWGKGRGRRHVCVARVKRNVPETKLLAAPAPLAVGKWPTVNRHVQLQLPVGWAGDWTRRASKCTDVALMAASLVSCRRGAANLVKNCNRALRCEPFAIESFVLSARTPLGKPPLARPFVFSQRQLRYHWPTPPRQAGAVPHAVGPKYKLS